MHTLVSSVLSGNARTKMCSRSLCISCGKLRRLLVRGASNVRFFGSLADIRAASGFVRFVA